MLNDKKREVTTVNLKQFRKIYIKCERPRAEKLCAASVLKTQAQNKYIILKGL